MTLLSQILEYAISEITSGSIYVVIGISWSVVYLGTKVLNFTSDEFAMLGGILTWGFHAAGLAFFIHREQLRDDNTTYRLWLKAASGEYIRANETVKPYA
jgi:hypothetical protein